MNPLYLVPTQWHRGYRSVQSYQIGLWVYYEEEGIQYKMHTDNVKINEDFHGLYMWAYEHQRVKV